MKRMASIAGIALIALFGVVGVSGTASAQVERPDCSNYNVCYW